MAGNKRWSKAEIEVLRKEYGREDVSFLAKKLGRSIDAVHWKASQLNIEFKRNDSLDISHRINTIEKKIDLLVDLMFSQQKVSAAHIIYIRENYHSFSTEKIAEDLKLPLNHVKMIIRKLLNNGMILKKYGGDQSLYFF